MGSQLLGVTVDKCHKATMPIIEDQTCRLAYGSSVIADGMICTGRSSFNIGPCGEDLGSPLFANNQLVGLYSWDWGCNLVMTREPSQYTFISLTNSFDRSRRTTHRCTLRSPIMLTGSTRLSMRDPHFDKYNIFRALISSLCISSIDTVFLPYKITSEGRWSYQLRFNTTNHEHPHGGSSRVHCFR